MKIVHAPFDINSSIDNKPNLEIEFSQDVKSVEIIATDIHGTAIKKKLIMNKDGKDWLIFDDKDSSRYKPCDDEIAADYFNGCCEHGGFDENLIKIIASRYDISVSIVKAVVMSFRDNFNKRKKEVERGE